MRPVFGIIKSVMDFHHFLLRGKDKVSGEWRLVCLAWSLKRMAVLRHKSVKVHKDGLNPLEFRKFGAKYLEMPE
ncbi:hypothetical protein GCM10027514_08710 [Azotobacter armeniacus]